VQVSKLGRCHSWFLRLYSPSLKIFNITVGIMLASSHLNFYQISFEILKGA